MLYEMDSRQYAAACKQVETSGATRGYVADYMAKIHRRAMHALVARYGKILSASELSVMMFITDRTLFYGTLSVLVYRDQFFNGMENIETGEMVFSGINISEMTLRKVLSRLLELNILDVGTCKSPVSGAEVNGRLYAINCKKLINADIMDEEKPMVLRIPKAKKEAQTPPLKLAPLYISKKDTKVSYSSAVAADADGCISSRRMALQSVAKPTQRAALATPSTMSVRERIASIQTAGATRKAQAIQAAKSTTSAMLTKASVQLLINELMTEYFPTLPPMRVTDKPFGKLRKDLKAQPIQNFNAFLQYVISSWSQIVSDHARAAKRQAAQGMKQTYSTMPAAPDFTTLAYRFTYFLKCYNSYSLQAAQIGTKEDRVSEENERLKRTVAQLRNEVISNRRVARQAVHTAKREAPTPTAPSPVARLRRTAPRPIHSDDADYIPTWEEQERKVK